MLYFPASHWARTRDGGAAKRRTSGGQEEDAEEDLQSHDRRVRMSREKTNDGMAFK